MKHLALAMARIETATGVLSVPLRAFAGDTADEARRLAENYAKVRGDELFWQSHADLVSNPDMGPIRGLGSFKEVLGALGITSIKMVVVGSVAHTSMIELVPAGTLPA
jgi:hypothetical protein